MAIVKVPVAAGQYGTAVDCEVIGFALKMLTSIVAPPTNAYDGMLNDAVAVVVLAVTVNTPAVSEYDAAGIVPVIKPFATGTCPASKTV